MDIQIQKQGNDVFRVTVKGRAVSAHTVEVSDSYFNQLTGGEVTKEELLRASFEFLLEREPNTSILSRFDLPVIQRYFSEYEQTMRERFA
ncbi:MAG: hypothetical protein GC154_11235 [bacterium]|nr:hypothetical protein [bacterium]